MTLAQCHWLRSLLRNLIFTVVLWKLMIPEETWIALWISSLWTDAAYNANWSITHRGKKIPSEGSGGWVLSFLPGTVGAGYDYFTLHLHILHEVRHCIPPPGKQFLTLSRKQDERHICIQVVQINTAQSSWDLNLAWWDSCILTSKGLLVWCHGNSTTFSGSPEKNLSETWSEYMNIWCRIVETVIKVFHSLPCIIVYF